MITTPPVPPWLARHEARLVASATGESWMVYLGHELAYVLVAVPAEGKHSVKVLETINGKQFNSGTIFASVQAALEGGAEELRQRLGW